MRMRGTNVQISVKDSGIGIADEDLVRLGEPFFQAQSGLNRKYEGTGLGLSIVQGLVGLHEGELKIRSTLGKGTTMIVELPIDGPKAQNQDRVVEEISDRRFELEERNARTIASRRVG